MASRPYSSPADVSADGKTKQNKKIPSTANQMGYSIRRLSFCFVLFFPFHLHFLIQCPEAPWIQNYFFIFLFIITTRQRSLTRTFLYHSDLLYKGNANTKRCCVCVVGCSCIDRRYLMRNQLISS